MHDQQWPFSFIVPGTSADPLPALRALGGALAKVLGDMPLAIMAVDARGIVQLWSAAAERMFGWTNAEVVGKPLPMIPPGLEGHAADVLQRSFGLELQGERLKRLRKDGTTLEVRLWTSRLLSDRGETLAVLGAMADDSKQLAQELALEEKTRTVELLLEVAVAANEADSLPPALRRTLVLVCQFSGWHLGHALTLSDSGGALQSTALWQARDPDLFEAFRRDTESRKFECGVDLPGRVLENGRPHVMLDISDPAGSPRAESARACGLRGAFAVPVVIHNQVVGALEFFHVAPLPPTPALLETMHNIGVQLGRVCERTRAERERNALAERAQRASAEAAAAQRERVLAPLSSREREVMRSLARGEDNLTISACLGISERTVKGHISAILRKLGHENRMQAARAAWTLGLFDDEA
jgi:PAS domain S-box-containing protein